MRIRPATASDDAGIAEIYAHYVDATAITFEIDAPGEDEMRSRIEAGGDLFPWFAAEEENGALAGYATAAPFRPRPAYRFTVETSVYLRAGAEGRGIGALLYAPLLQTLEAQGFTQAIAAIALPNAASVRLHEFFGFAHAGTYRSVGWKLGRWHDVGLWQRPLAAPSPEPEEPLPWPAVSPLNRRGR